MFHELTSGGQTKAAEWIGACYFELAKPEPPPAADAAKTIAAALLASTVVAQVIDDDGRNSGWPSEPRAIVAQTSLCRIYETAMDAIGSLEHTRRTGPTRSPSCTPT